MKQESNRIQWVSIRLRPMEYTRIQGKLKTTTCRKFSEYARLALLSRHHNLTPRISNWMTSCRS